MNSQGFFLDTDRSKCYPSINKVKRFECYH